MRTLRITLLASLAGWAVGFLSGSMGGLVLMLVEFDLKVAMQSLTVQGLLLSEVQWGFVMAVAILPGSLLFVAPLVFQALSRSSFWHPFRAACVGGGLGIVGAVCWYVVVLLFTTPINWSRPSDRAAAAMFAVVACMVGATTGCVAILAARSYARMMPTSSTSARDEQPPPVPYEY